jgi:hypothetical protein
MTRIFFAVSRKYKYKVGGLYTVVNRIPTWFTKLCVIIINVACSYCHSHHVQRNIWRILRKAGSTISALNLFYIFPHETNRFQDSDRRRVVKFVSSHKDRDAL